MRRLILFLLVMSMICTAACAQIRVYCADVGKGDALLVMSEDYTCLIDTAKADKWDTVASALERFDIVRLDAVFITHTDRDHTGGLKNIKKLMPDAVYAPESSVIGTGKKHPAVKAAKKLNTEVHWLNAGDTIPLGASGAVFRVLAPLETFEDNEDDNSLVMMLESADGKMLFTGDMELREEDLLLTAESDLKCDVLKVANHGDSDACSRELITACMPKYAVISTDPVEKPGTPDPRILRQLKEIGCESFSTENGGILITMNSGEITVEYK